jgi:UDP-3-O-[3-hydroxymyristoyl] glucosamine N-acyltransferase
MQMSQSQVGEIPIHLLSIVIGGTGATDVVLNLHVHVCDHIHIFSQSSVMGQKVFKKTLFRHNIFYGIRPTTPQWKYRYLILSSTYQEVDLCF